MKRIGLITGVLLLLVACFGLPPLFGGEDRESVLNPGYLPFETGVKRLPSGVMQVSALTRMPKVKGKMVRWWLADYMQTSEHYKVWHPTAHVWMDWENKEPGEIVGASHLVHEYIGDELLKLRIQFVPPEEILGVNPNSDTVFAVCARAGFLEEPINATKMCHVMRDTEWGTEMRSTFWMGHVAKRDGNEEVASIEGAIGNLAIVRLFAVSESDALSLMQHAIEEMGYLSDLLPELYAANG